MVLRNARLHALVDDGCTERECPGAMPHGLALSALLQFPDRLHTEPVLASHNDILLLRAAQPRPSLPHLLPSAVLAPARRVIRTLARTFLMAPYLRFYAAIVHGADTVYGFPRVGSVKYFDLYLEQEESGYHAQLPGDHNIQGTVSSMGAAVLLIGHARHCAQGRNVWDRSGSHLVLLQRRLPTPPPRPQPPRPSRMVGPPLRRPTRTRRRTHRRRDPRCARRHAQRPRRSPTTRSRNKLDTSYMFILRRLATPQTHLRYPFQFLFC